MLLELVIKNFAIIDEVHCHFDKEMTVLTGETGAGKSIIIDAVGLLIGERASTDMIRTGSERAIIQGLFEVEHPQLMRVLDEMGMDYSDGQILLQRELFQNGKSSCRINGQLTTVAMLKQIGHYLIDIHGQNEHFLLLNTQKQIHLLDEFAKEDLAPLQEEYQNAYQTYKEAKASLANYEQGQQNDAQRMDMLTFQLNEIDQANIRLNEEEELAEEKQYYTHFKKIQHTFLNVLQLMEDNQTNAMDSLGEAMSLLEGIESIDEKYYQFSKQTSDAFYQLQDVLSSIRNEADSAIYDEERLNEIEERLYTYQQLKRKYGDSAEKILNFKNRAREELYNLQHKEEIIERLMKSYVAAKEVSSKIAQKISVIRKEAAKALSKEIEEHLTHFYMPDTKFHIQVSETDELHAYGKDKVEFFIATNLGEPLKSLNKIVSGGELSRITLVLKSIFAKHQSVSTIVFDEIDTGVSGRVAQAFAEKMKVIAQYSQVLCITHLPQVAALAEHHIKIEKLRRDETTATQLFILKGEEHIDEVARMLSGDEVTELTREHAKELIEKGLKKRNDEH